MKSFGIFFPLRKCLVLKRQRIRRMGKAKISMSHMHMVINEERLASHGGEQLWQFRLALRALEVERENKCETCQ